MQLSGLQMQSLLNYPTTSSASLHLLTTLPPHPSPSQVVTDDMWESRFERFPVHPPRTREYYLLRAIFESHFPHPDAIKTVPQVCVRGGMMSRNWRRQLSESAGGR